MKNSILAIAAVIALTLATFASTNANTSERPAGVAAEEWIAINDKVGFVIVPNRYQPAQIASQALLLTPSKAGYFVVKGAAGWTRLVIVEPVKGPGDVG